MRRYNPDSNFDDDMDFADPGGRSALRAASKHNPRNLPCPSCGRKNRLTPADAAAGYQCDACAARSEGDVGSFLAAGGSIGDY